MSKYFAKYLPVEGQIKEGDHIVDPIIAPKDGLDYISGDKFTDPMGSEIILVNWKQRFNFVKQKLFLCSRDIQWMDKFFFENISPELIYNKQSDNVPYWINCDGILYAREKCFKVIGEISPDATWIKEGDEFEDSDLEPCLQSTEFPDQFNYLHDMDMLIEYLKYCPIAIHLKPIIKIKGSCGNFH